MLQITIPAGELWDESIEEFVFVEEQTLKFEHSLISVSKWEAKWEKSFFCKEKKTSEEIADYIKCMSITPNTEDSLFNRLSVNDIQKINDYIEAPMTATTINDPDSKKSDGSILTSELIYYNMIALNIPFECQKWHLNRLLMLIRVCEIKNRPPKKMSTRDVRQQYAAINAARRKKYNTRG